MNVNIYVPFLDESIPVVVKNFINNLSIKSIDEKDNINKLISSSMYSSYDNLKGIIANYFLSHFLSKIKESKKYEEIVKDYVDKYVKREYARTPLPSNYLYLTNEATEMISSALETNIYKNFHKQSNYIVSKLYASNSEFRKYIKLLKTRENISYIYGENIARHLTGFETSKKEYIASQLVESNVIEEDLFDVLLNDIPAKEWFMIVFLDIHNRKDFKNKFKITIDEMKKLFGPLNKRKKPFSNLIAIVNPV